MNTETGLNNTVKKTYLIHSCLDTIILASIKECGETAVFAGKDTMKQQCVTQVMHVFYSHDCTKCYDSIKYPIHVQ